MSTAIIKFKSTPGQIFAARLINAAGQQVGSDITDDFVEPSPGWYKWEANGAVPTTFEGEIRIIRQSDGAVIRRVPITGNVVSYPPPTHNHAKVDVDNLESDLLGKCAIDDPRLSDARTPLSHAHPQSEVTGLAATLASKADTSHTHTEANITGLVADLAAKEVTANKNAANGYEGLDASSKINGAHQVYGSASNTACQGNDARLSDARVPSGSAGGDLTGTFPNPTIKPSVALTTPNIGAATGTSLAATGNITSSGGVLGYAVGAGGTQTQSPNKSSAVTLNKLCGQITLSNAALAAGAIVSFTLTNSFIANTDLLIINHVSGGTVGPYLLNGNCGAGSAIITIRNTSAGSLSEAIVIRFAVFKASTN